MPRSQCRKAKTLQFGYPDQLKKTHWFVKESSIFTVNGFRLDKIRGKVRTKAQNAGWKSNSGWFTINWYIENICKFQVWVQYVCKCLGSLQRFRVFLKSCLASRPGIIGIMRSHTILILYSDAPKTKGVCRRFKVYVYKYIYICIVYIYILDLGIFPRSSSPFPPFRAGNRHRPLSSRVRQVEDDSGALTGDLSPPIAVPLAAMKF